MDGFAALLITGLVVWILVFVIKKIEKINRYPSPHQNAPRGTKKTNRDCWQNYDDKKERREGNNNRYNQSSQYRHPNDTYEPKSQNPGVMNSIEKGTTENFTLMERQKLTNAIKQLKNQYADMNKRIETLEWHLRMQNKTAQREHEKAKVVFGSESRSNSSNMHSPGTTSNWGHPDDNNVTFRYESVETISPKDEIDRIYNEAIFDPEKQSNFRLKYKPESMDVSNAMDRRADPSLEPTFEDIDRGNYLAVCIDESRKLYAVYPRFDVPLEPSSYGAGAMGKVFECRNYEEGHDFVIVEVKKSATFEKRAGNRWGKIRQGVLELKRQD